VTRQLALDAACAGNPSQDFAERHRAMTAPQQHRTSRRTTLMTARGWKQNGTSGVPEPADKWSRWVPRFAHPLAHLSIAQTQPDSTECRYRPDQPK
jgi:hypothetical protein